MKHNCKRYVFLVYAQHKDNTEAVLAAYGSKHAAEKHVDHLFVAAEGERSNAALLGIRSARIERMKVHES